MWLPLLCLTPPTEGFPWDDLRKIFIQSSRMAKVPHGVEILRKISITWVGRTNVTDDRQTDRQQTDGPSMTYSEHELEFTFAKDYLLDLRENFTRDMFVNKEELVKFWMSSASWSGSRNFLKDFTTLQDTAFFQFGSAYLCLYLSVQKWLVEDVPFNVNFVPKWTTFWLSSGIIALKIRRMPY